MNFVWDLGPDRSIEFDWLVLCIKNLSLENFQLLGYALWYLWFARNFKLHGESRMSANLKAHIIVDLAVEFKKAKEKAAACVPQPIQNWKSPLQGCTLRSYLMVL